ncbi:MAG: nitrate reductase [Planctomycetes bacterium]|nr:nitrate reductase [Planctomycetota bacterium]
MNLFSQKPAHDPAVAERLKGWARELLGLGDDVAVTVMQLNCAEDDCPDVETVVGVLEQGNQRKFKVLKPLAEVTRDDLATALRQST